MNINGDVLYGAPEWVLILAFWAMMLASSEAGFRFGRRPGMDASESLKPQVSTVEAGILGVLALLLGFTMSMAVTRFEARRQLVLEEANAIGTAHLRTQMLPAQEGQEIAHLLRAYVDVRIPPATGRSMYEQIMTAREQSARLQNAFWGCAIAYARKEPLRAGLLVQSLNLVIDLDEARWTAFQNHVPSAIIYVIAMVGLLAIMIVGYTFGLGGHRQLASVCMLSLAISMVLAVIIDLDRPREGFIHVSQQPMLDLQRQLSTR